MISFLKNFKLNNFKREENDKKLTSNTYSEELANEIREVCMQMENVNNWFQIEDDNDLIEACIHQREVLNARYRYLIGKIKLQNVS